MSSHAARRVARRPSRARIRRRRLAMLAVAGLVGAPCAAVVTGLMPEAVKEITLPLRHDDIIRQQAADKGLDPALIAGVIYTESRFRDQTSHAGAKGLMQLLPSTADDIARKSGGTAFVQGDLADPQVNISYGSFYLRYLLQRYGGNTVLAIAAYNAGEGRVDQWVFDARHRGEEFDHARHIPFPETRHYVQQVLEMRGRYRDRYKQELGL
jgi:soluble lytic murein transglycosylase